MSEQIEQVNEEKKVDILDDKFKQERSDWSNKINDVIKKLNRIEDVSDAQVLSLSYRQILLELSYKYKSIVSKYKSSDKSFKKDRMDYYKRSYDMRLEQREINEYIASDMAIRARKLELLENHISFLYNSIDTIDKITWAVKNKIEIHNANL